MTGVILYYQTKNYRCESAPHELAAECNYVVINNENQAVEVKCMTLTEALATTFALDRDLDEIREAIQEATPNYYDDEDEAVDESDPVILN